MSFEYQQNQSTSPLIFLLVASADHLSGLTGKAGSVVVTISKNGGAFATPAGVISEIGNGFYAVAPSTIDCNTIGPLIVHAKDAASDPSDETYQIVAELSIAYGIVVAGSTGAAVTLSGLPPGKSYTGQHLAQTASAEARVIASQSFNSSNGNYTFNFSGPLLTEAGPFSAINPGEAMLPTP